MTALSNAEVATELNRSLQPLGVVPLELELPEEPSIASLRRRRRTREYDRVGILTLVDIDGVLLWEEGPVCETTSRLRRRAGAAAQGEVVTQLKFVKEPGLNQIIEKLVLLDQQLTPQGPGQLIEYDRQTWQGVGGASIRPAGRVLLLIHGTFSSTGAILEELRAEPVGLSFLQRVAAAYDQILGFDHFTLSRTPVVNAVELARLIGDSQAEIDIISHSRGGLVARWFCEVLDRLPTRPRKVILVGCPLRGTSLADPQSLRNGLNLLTNLGKALGSACKLIPLLAAAGGLMQILASIGSFAARTPVVDAGVGLIPGLAALSRIRNNSELAALNYGRPQPRPNYFAIIANFQTEDPKWRFWRWFNKSKATDLAADYLVFEQDNDLVVDTESMTYYAFGENPDLQNRQQFCCFEGDRVYHTNYFRSSEALNFILTSLKI